MDLLRCQDVLIDEHSCIGIIKVLVIGALRVMCMVRLSNVAKDVASDLAKFKHTFHTSFPNIPIGVVQGFPSLSDCHALTNRDLDNQWHHSHDVQVCESLSGPTR